MADENKLIDILNISKEQAKIIAYKYNVVFNDIPIKPILKDATKNRKSGLSLKSRMPQRNDR